MQAAVRGLALFLAAGVALLILGVWGADLFGFRSPAVWTMRVLTGALVLAVAWRFLFVPWRRRISNEQAALYVEERYPQLQDRLVTAVEYGEGSRVSPGLLDLLVRDTAQKMRFLDFSVFTDRRRLAAYGTMGLFALIGLALLLGWGPSFFSYGFERLYVPWSKDP
ncbi:MAG: hypothetical protein ABIG68_03785, partial [Acidobacteriota bacterium]